jgi:hypothetical protein
MIVLFCISGRVLDEVTTILRLYLVGYVQSALASNGKSNIPITEPHQLPQVVTLPGVGGSCVSFACAVEPVQISYLLRRTLMLSSMVS